MKEFFKKLIAPKSGQSSRRFIALLQLPILNIGCVVAIFSKNDYLITLGIAIPFLILMFAYFSLSWDNAKELLASVFKSENRTKDPVES